MTKFKTTASVCENDTERVIQVKGQTARALVALVEASDSGITALEVSTWAYRLAAYCHELRHRCGLSIRTEREEHPEGWHGRYVLESPVQIVRVEDPGQANRLPARAGGQP